MNFIYKCYLQRLLSSTPRGEKLNFFFQKYITKSLPINDKSFIKRLAIAKELFNTFARYTQLTDTQSITYYEFGAGWDLINPVGLSLLGIQKLHCIDIRELAFPELVNDTISRLYRLKEKISFDYSLPERIPLLTASNCKDILMNYFRINYRAPIDARHTDFQEATVDFIASISTLEHIPKDDIAKIFQECYRILKKGGIISCRINYRDHWAENDHSISIYNFLKYSASEWQRYSPSLHYQNRLRHKDYLDIISQTGFKILDDNPVLPSEKEVDSLRNLEIEADFLSKYTLEELAIKGTSIVLKK